VAYAPTAPSGLNARRSAKRDLPLEIRNQTLAVYSRHPSRRIPIPYFRFPMDREAGIEAYQAMIRLRSIKDRMAKGE